MKYIIYVIIILSIGFDLKLYSQNKNENKTTQHLDIDTFIQNFSNVELPMNYKKKYMTYILETLF